MTNSDISKLNIAVVYGGDSTEREISIKSGTCVARALREAQFNVVESNITHCEINDVIQNADLIFPVLHGGFGENGDFQELLEKNHKPFVGAGSKACHIIMDKIDTKKYMDANQIPTAAWITLSRTATDRSFPKNMTLPVVVKAPHQGSSVGISMVRSPEEWLPALELAFKYDDIALIESFIQGTEVTCGIINGHPLPLIELRFCGEFYDYDAKYTYKNGATQYLCPPPDIPEAIQKKTQEYAVKFAQVCDAESLVRVDFIIDAKGTPFVLEGNAIPGFTDTSLVPKAAQQSGLTFPELCTELVLNAAKRYHLISDSFSQ